MRDNGMRPEIALRVQVILNEAPEEILSAFSRYLQY